MSKPAGDMAPPKSAKYSPKIMSDEDFWSKPPEGPETWEEDRDLLDDPQFKDPVTTDKIHIHIHMR
jgi:hypothetical protein